MKNIYLFGLFTRLFMIIAILFMIYLGIYNCINVGNYTENIILISLFVIFLILVIYWQWTIGLFINKKRNRLVFSFYLNKSKNIERIINKIQSIELEENKNMGFSFIVNHKDGYSEKIFYKFYRMVWMESIQKNRLKRRLKNFNKVLKNI